MNKLKGTDKIDYADFLHIIFADKCIKKFLGNYECLDFTFNDIMKCAKENGFKEDIDVTILVVAENPLSGKVYRYGNYGPYWVEIGSTRGYA